MRKLRLRIVVIVVVLAGAPIASTARAQASRYGVGRPMPPTQRHSRYDAVAPDGTGLPPGHGTVAQGRTVYAARCAKCHGDRGQGIAEYPALVGGVGTLTSNVPLQTIGSFWPYATTVWDYIHRAMPYQRPGSLANGDVYALTAYLLNLNHVVPENADLSDTNLAKVSMPNRHGFVADPRPDLRMRLDGRSGPRH